MALASLHDGEILDAEQLPLRYAGFSPCFRREAGAAGKDTRGIFRVHQFDKVEMFSFVAPEDSPAEHERILAIEEEVLAALELPYRVVNIAVAELGNSAAKKFDCEVWLPSQERYRELTSCSNTTDYQARRLNIRARRERPGAGARWRRCTRSTAPPWRSGARSWRCSRTASSRTDRCSCPRRWCPSARPRGSTSPPASLRGRVSEDGAEDGACGPAPQWTCSTSEWAGPCGVVSVRR